MGTYKDQMTAAEFQIIGAALAKSGGEVRGAARRLKMSERTLHHRIKTLGIQRANFAHLDPQNLHTEKSASDPAELEQPDQGDSAKVA